MNEIIQHDVTRPWPLADESVQCIITSPPYWGLRDYGAEGQLGLEPTPEAYLEKMVAVFREARRVLRKDGTLWLNMGDSYAGGKQGRDDYGDSTSTLNNAKPGSGKTGNKHSTPTKQRTPPPGLKPKDLCGIPWRLALALQADGWWLRQDIIWAKGNPMPESCTDRNTKSHEYIFLLTKSPHYYYDNIAIRERAKSENENLQYLQEDLTGKELLQKQSAKRRKVWPVCRLYQNSQKKIRPEIQQNREGQSECPEILLFGEGTKKQKGLSEIICYNSRNKGALKDITPGIREETEIQKSPEEILSFGEGQDNESQEGCPLCQNSKRTFGQETDGLKKKILSCQYSMYIDIGGMGSDKETIQLPLCLLPKREKIGNGPCNTIEQKRTSYERECCPSLPNLQRKEEQPHYRNARSVWHINTQPYAEAHFATFPEELVRRCMLAGTSERGACPDCGRAWVRVVEKKKPVTRTVNADTPPGQTIQGNFSKERFDDPIVITTLGWRPQCACGKEPVPCVVHDPFCGAGTTPYVALKGNRWFTAFELKQEYIDMANRRIAPLLGQAKLL